MSTYDDMPSSRDRRSRRAPRDYDDADDEDYYRRPKAKPAKRDDYEGGDEDEAPRRRHHDSAHSSREKIPKDPDIPPPPIGEDRSDAPDAAAGYRKSPKDSRSPPKSRDRDPYEGKGLSRHRSSRQKAKDPYEDDFAPRRSHRSRGDYDEPEPPRRHKARDPYDEPPRRSKPSRDAAAYDDLEPRRRSKPARDPYDEPRHRSSRHRAYPDEDTDPEPERPRRRREDKPSRYEEGYGTDRPRRQPRDDYDRGYRTDGRDSRRDSNRERRHDRRDRRDPRDAPRKDSRGDYDDDHDDRKHSRSGKKKDGVDMHGLMEKGKKHWKTVEPIAKPLAQQLVRIFSARHVNISRMLTSFRPTRT